MPERDAFAKTLAQQGFALPERILKILVKNQLGRTKTTPVYDLEFDTALNAAIDLLDNPDYPRLLAQAKSVRELVEAKKAAEPKAQASGKAAIPAPEPTD